MDLHLNTVSDLLWNSLKKLMTLKEFNSFRLVGGTSLSLQLGHRKSIDIDLFTDADYGAVDFEKLEIILKSNFSYVDSIQLGPVGMGKSFFIGNKETELVKLDLYYTDKFVFPIRIVEGVRLACKEEIVAMKLDVIGRGGRKKDFWDLHELLNKYSINEMIEFYIKRYPYNFTENEILRGLTNFDTAENDFTPICFQDKVWEIIKLDFEEAVEEIRL